MMVMSMRMEMWLVCKLCRLPLHLRDEDAPVVFGVASSYEVCPKCSHNVGEIDSKDQNYRRRYRRFVEKQTRKFE
jgi:hypothetical protein